MKVDFLKHFFLSNEFLICSPCRELLLYIMSQLSLNNFKIKLSALRNINHFKRWQKVERSTWKFFCLVFPFQIFCCSLTKALNSLMFQRTHYLLPTERLHWKNKYFSYSMGHLNKTNVIEVNLNSQNQFLNVWSQEKFVCKKEVLKILGSSFSLEYLHF